MGKQNGRLYFNGEDHCDVVFKAGRQAEGYFANHSAIYFGGSQVWQRERPYLMFAGGGRIYTTEKTRFLSEFHANSLMQEYERINDHIVGTAFLGGRYFIATVLGLFYSYDGYNWKNFEMPLGLTPPYRIQYMGLLGRTGSEKDIIVVVSGECILFISSKQGILQADVKYTFSSKTTDVRVRNSGECILVGTAYGDYAYPLRAVVRSDGIIETNGGVHVPNIYEGQESGCFYRFQSSDIERSYDGISWSHFFKAPTEIDENGAEVMATAGRIAEVGGWLYFFGYLNGNLYRNAYTVWRMDAKSGKAQKNVMIPEDNANELYISSVAAINGIFLISYVIGEKDADGHRQEVVCRTDDIFRVRLEGRGLSNTELVRTTFLKTSDYGLELGSGACSDGALRFYFLGKGDIYHGA